MNKGLLFSVIVNVMLFSMIFYVKSNATQQAKDYVKEQQVKAKEIVANANKVHTYNTLLWQLAVDAQQAESKDRKSIVKMVKTFVKENSDKAQLVEEQDPKNKKQWKVGWASYHLFLQFDKGQLVGIDYSGMLDQ